MSSPETFVPGYHITPIAKGEIGEISKIEEEVEELKDAARQGARIMILVELSDLVGAIELYLDKHHPDTTLDDLTTMAHITARAFQNGVRQ